MRPTMTGPNEMLREQMQQAQRHPQSLPNALSFPASTNTLAPSARARSDEEELPGYTARGNEATQYQFYREDFATYNLSCLHDPQRSHLVQLLEGGDPAGSAPKRRLQFRKTDINKERLNSRTIRVCRRQELAYSAQVATETELAAAARRCADIRPTYKKALNMRQQDPYIPLETAHGLIPLHLYRGDYYHFNVPLEAHPDPNSKSEKREPVASIKLEWRIQWTFHSSKNDYKLRRVFKGMKLGILGGPTTQVIGWFLPTMAEADDQAFAEAPANVQTAMRSAQQQTPRLERQTTRGSTASDASLPLEQDLNKPATLGNLILTDAVLDAGIVPGWQAPGPSEPADRLVELIREMALTSFLALFFRVVLADTMHEKVAKYTMDGASLGRGMMC